IGKMYRSGQGYKKISAALKVPKSTVAFIILKWKTFGTTRTLPRAGRPAKLSYRGRRALVREVSKDPRTTAKTLVNDSVKSGSGIDISTKTDTRGSDRNRLRGCRPRKTPLLKKRHLQARLKFEGQLGEKLYILETCPLVRRDKS
uniref:Transposase Tc1-like domain-containing protein n=1 Tax=Cyprinus carpio carpio TaxID=630221 RepID=A0A9J7XP94_CYPCA